MLSRHSKLGLVLGLAVAGAGMSLQAGVIWDGGGAASTSWGTAANWDLDTLPAFDGTDQISITTGFGANTALSLGSDRSIGRITFGGGATAISLAAGNTLRLNSTTTSNAAGTALWNANTNDGKAATIGANLLLQSGTGGTYTGYFRENSNSDGGTQFNGVISQGAGESWTMRFTQGSARAAFRLNNASNNVTGIYSQSIVTSMTPGSFGSALLTMNAGTLGTSTVDHYTTAVSNNITLAGAGTWSSGIATRLTGALSQSTQTLTYGGGNTGFTRADYNAVTGTGSTNVVNGALWVTDMAKLTSGQLSLGSTSTAGFSAFILSGTGSSDAPTWADFATARTYNQTSGANTWRINVAAQGGNTGGFAARGADVTIPNSGGGLSNATFARNFQLGSTATFANGTRIANKAVILNTDIAFTAAEYRPVIAWNTEVVAGSASTAWTLGGPVHELNGILSGNNIEMVPLSGGSSNNRGIVRVTNASNSLTGSSVWVLGSTRTPWNTPGGITISSSNPDDNSGVVAIFTSDVAFGGSGVEVVVSSLGSSGTATNAMLLFEDTNGSGSTTFNKNFNLLNNTGAYTSGFGSWAGDVIYTGDVTMPLTQGTNGAAVVHVRGGTMTMGTAGDTAGIINNRSVATTYYKEGAGTLDLTNLVLSGTQASNSWNIRGGKLLVNQTLATGGVTVATGSILGGAGKITGTTTVQNGGHIAPGNSPGILNTDNFTMSAGAIYDWQRLGGGTPVYDQVLIATGKTLTVSGAWTLNLYDLGGAPAVLADKFYLFRVTDNNYAGTAGTVTISHNDWLQTPTVGADSNGIYITNIPEPTSLSLLGLGAAGLLLRRRRQA